MNATKKAVVVEDTAPIRRLLEFLLQRMGFEVHTEGNGKSAVALIHEQKPRVVVTDFNLPGLTGKEICEQTAGLKADHPFLTVVISGGLTPEDQVWADAVPDTVLVKKPFENAELQQIIEGYMNKEDAPAA